MIPYIKNLKDFDSNARFLGFVNFEDLVNSHNNAYSKTIYVVDIYPIRIRVRVYKNTGLVEVKAFRHDGIEFKELKNYLSLEDIQNHLKTIEKFIIWRNEKWKTK